MTPRQEKELKDDYKMLVSYRNTTEEIIKELSINPKKENEVMWHKGYLTALNQVLNMLVQIKE